MDALVCAFVCTRVSVSIAEGLCKVTRKSQSKGSSSLLLQNTVPLVLRLQSVFICSSYKLSLISDVFLYLQSSTRFCLHHLLTVYVCPASIISYRSQVSVFIISRSARQYHIKN